MIVNRDLGVGYLRSPKTGSTSVASALESTGVFESIQPQHNTLDEHFEQGLITEREANTWKTFVFIREPHERLLSALTYINLSFDPSDVWKDSDAGKMELFLRPQARWLEFQGRRVVTPLRFDEIQKGTDRICRAVGMEPVGLPYMNRNRNFGQVHYDELRPQIEDFVNEHLWEDLELFNSIQ
jgi:hypothetical protein